MRTISLDTYKKELVDGILSARDFDDLSTKLFDASCDLAGYESHEISDEAMAAIIRRSQQDVAAGRVYSMKDVELFMNQKVYELTHRMDGNCVAESFSSL